MMQETRIFERYALVSAFGTRTRFSLPCCDWLRDETDKLQVEVPNARWKKTIKDSRPYHESELRASAHLAAAGGANGIYLYNIGSFQPPASYAFYHFTGPFLEPFDSPYENWFGVRPHDWFAEPDTLFPFDTFDYLTFAEYCTENGISPCANKSGASGSRVGHSRDRGVEI